MTELTTELQRGAELAGYRIEALLGRGGMGVVYLAEQLRLKRRVALKLLAPELAADQRFRERFLRESELAASLDHPNVVPIFDAGEAEGLLYIAMRYVEGTSLATLLAEEGRLDPERALAIVSAVGASLDAAHARGLVHRDVKPANVLLAEGHVYLADFGLTRSAQEGAPEEKPHLSGTLDYVAPEQIEGDLPDPSADIYALGCVLYHCLTGEPPFAKRTQMELLWAHFSEDPPSVRERRPELPEAIDPVIAAALAKEPGERYATGRELAGAAAQALGLRWMAKAREWDDQRRDRSLLLRGGELRAAEAFLAEVGEGAEPALTALQRDYVSASRTVVSRRQRLLMAASVAVATVAVVSLVFALISRGRATTEARRADDATLVAKSRLLASESEAQLSVDPERSILLAMAAVRTSPTNEAVFALRSALDQSPLRVRLPSVGSQGPFKGPAIAYSPDGDRLIVGSVSGIATVFDTSSGRVLRRIESGDYAAIVGWSPDGSRIAVEEGCSMTIRDATTYELLLRQMDQCSGPGYSYAFSPDGSALYYANHLRVVRWDLSSNELQILAETDIDGVLNPGQVALSPDGRRLAVAGLSRGVALLDATSGQVLATAEHDRSILWLAFDPEGTQLAAAESSLSYNGGTIALLDGHSLASRRTIANLSGPLFTSVAFSPDGSRLAYGASDGTAGIYSLDTGEQLISLPGHTSMIFQVAFSPDGHYLASSEKDGTTLIWQATTSEQLSIDTGGIDPNVGGSMFDQSELLFPAGLVARHAPTDGAQTGHVVIDAWTRNGTRAAAPLVVGRAEPNTMARLSLDGRFAVTLDATLSELTIWDVAARRAARTLGHVGNAPIAPGFSPDGTHLAYGVYGEFTGETEPAATMRLLDTATDRQRNFGKTSCGGIDTVWWQAWAFSPDGARLAATDSCGELEIWNTTTKDVVGHRVEFGDLSSLGPVRFSVDGEHVAVGNTNNVGQVSILDVASDQTVAVLKEHTRTVQDIAYSPDGSLLATASLDGTARVWDARTGRPLRAIEHPEGVSNVAFSPDSRSLATLDFVGTIRVWDACTACEDPPALMAIAESRVTRELTDSERDTFGVG